MRMRTLVALVRGPLAVGLGVVAPGTRAEAGSRVGTRPVASRSLTRGLAGLLALVALLALACRGGGDPAAPPPTADAAATPSVAHRETATPTPERAPAATPSPAPTAAPRETATAPPAATPTPEATPEPTQQAVSVAGPLLVLSERVRAEQETGDREIEVRRIVVYDVASERYWSPFEYRDGREGGSGVSAVSAVRPAGAGLIVWSEGELRRMSLTGEVEAVLLEDGGIREIEVSPDGAKVAVMSGEPGTLLVLDAASGEELLRVAGADPPLGSLLDGVRPGRLELGTWNTDGDAVGVSAGGYPDRRFAIASLGGEIRVLPEGVLVSTDLRYAIRFGEIIERSARTQHAPVWAGLEILDAETGRVAWSVEGSIGPPRDDPSSWTQLEGPARARLLDRAGYSAFDVPRAGTWLLDTATGELGALAHSLDRLPRGRAASTCPADADARPGSRACDVRYDGNVAWEGARGWTRYIGMIEPPGELAVPGADLRRVARDAVPPPPPARDEMVGPLLAYEVHGEHEPAPGSLEPRATRRVILYDEGTGRSWLAFTYRNGFAYGNDRGVAQAARGGLVASIDGELVWVAPDGWSEVVRDRWPEGLRVSPDGRMAIAEFPGGGGPARTVVLGLPSGDEILSHEADGLFSALAPGPPAASSYRDVRPGGWTADSGAILLTLIGGDAGVGGQGLGVGAIGTLDGALRQLPCVPGRYWEALACLSPDARYVVRGRVDRWSEYGSEYWRSFDIVDFDTNRVLWSLETAAPLYPSHWEWASADHFAWSSGAGPGEYRFDVQRPGGERAAVSVIDVTTGNIEVMEGADYRARFHPPSRATTECSGAPGTPCDVLLDGEVIGEGRWPRIIGFIGLGSTLPYDGYDATGAVTHPGSYAFLAPADDGTMAVVTTYEALRDGTTTALLIHTSDASGASRADLYDDVAPGDIVEWREAHDCFVRYRVTEVGPDAAGAVPRRALGIEWIAYAYTGCRGTLSPAPVLMEWDPPAIASRATGSRAVTLITSPIRYGPYLLIPVDWEGALEPHVRVGLPSGAAGTSGGSPGAAPEWPSWDPAEVRRHPLWRDPVLPAGWTLGGVEAYDQDSLAATYGDADSAVLINIAQHANRPFYQATPGGPGGNIWEARLIDGRPAVLWYDPLARNKPVNNVSVFDEATAVEYTVSSYAGSDIHTAIEIARSLLPRSATR